MENDPSLPPSGPKVAAQGDQNQQLAYPEAVTLGGGDQNQQLTYPEAVTLGGGDQIQQLAYPEAATSGCPKSTAGLPGNINPSERTALLLPSSPLAPLTTFPLSS